MILKEELAKELLENQQKEIRAYDQKAGYYIASNSGLFVIALFTLCIFTMFHNDHTDIAKYAAQWWILLILSLLYVICFLGSSICCLGVLFARVKKAGACSCRSITSPFSVDVNDLDNELVNTQKNMEEIREYHIKMNVSILRKKHSFANAIPFFSICMGVLLFLLMLFLFIF